MNWVTTAAIVGSIFAAVTIYITMTIGQEDRMEYWVSTIETRFQRLEDSVNSRIDRTDDRFGRLLKFSLDIYREMYSSTDCSGPYPDFHMENWEKEMWYLPNHGVNKIDNQKV